MLKKSILLSFLIILFFSFFISLPTQVKAADVTFSPQVSIPGYTPDFTQKTTAPIGEYIKAIFKYGIGIVGIIATVVLMFGGVLWLTAGGDSGKIGEAQSWITAAITGLVLAIGSYLILATVNPALVSFNVSGIKSVASSSNTSVDQITNRCNEECKNNPTPGFVYDPKTDTCNCIGSGKHTECQMKSSISSGKEIQSPSCVEVSTAGSSSCSSDGDCTKKIGCCSGSSLLSSSCISGLDTTLQSCQKLFNTSCNTTGVFTTCHFETNSHCNGNACISY